MGIEPFIIKKPTAEKQAETRDGKIAALAQLLYSRGLTSSMTDARRLADGMVEVEKRVIKQSTDVFHTATHTDIADTNERTTTKQPSDLQLPETFQHFVAHAATMNHATTMPNSIPPKTDQQVTYGRDNTQSIAHVPHIMAHKQVFYEDAPPITMARGYNGPKPQNVDFTAQRDDVIKQLHTPERAAEVMTIETNDTGMAITKTTETPTSQTIDQTIIIPEPTPETTATITKETSAPNEERPTVDLAKQHGVDLFEMFKKK